MKLFLPLVVCASVAAVYFFSNHRLEAVSYSPNSIEYPKLVKPKINLVNWDDEILQGIKNFEGFYPSPYICPGGVRTVGYGHTGKYSNQKISLSKAESLLLEEVNKAAHIVDRRVKVNLTQWQRNALISFTFNCGEAALKTLISGKGRLNDGNYESVSKLLPKYVYAKGVKMEGLVKRRGWEVEIWKGIFTL
jgi:lysozyme